MDYWAEMTVLGNKEPGSAWDLGRRLWSPKSNASGAEYKVMLEPRSGDAVLHLVAGVDRSAPKARFLYGISRVAAPCKEVMEEPPRAGDWAGRGIYYRIDLQGYQELDPKPRMQEVEAGLSDLILDELETLKPRHYPYMTYGIGFRGRQGVYLARLTPALYTALSTVAAILPRAPANVEEPTPETAIARDFVEGERQTREATFFKRNPALRREAIRQHGAICIACKFNFEEKYGEAGKGYIEIHHLNPLAERLDAASGEPRLTTAEDVVPLCANCHCVVHRARPALTLDELRSTIRKGMARPKSAHDDEARDAAFISTQEAIR